MRLSPQSLARATSRRPWLTIGLWLLGLVVAGVLSSRLGDSALTEEFAFTNEPESVKAEALVEERLRGAQKETEILVVSSSSTTVEDPAFRQYVDRLRGEVLRLGPAFSPTTFYDTQAPNLVSKDRRTTLVPVALAEQAEGAPEPLPALREVIADNRAPGFSVRSFGLPSLNEDFNKLSDETLRKGEVYGMAAALVILIVVFGAVVAAFVPILVGVLAIALAVGMVAVVGQLSKFSFFVIPMISMMGLAVGIDYSLFVVSRYREERARGREKLEAIESAGATASRAVFFSGMTVVLALLGMLLVPTTIFRSLAGGAIFVVLIAVLASLTLLPALLGLLGDRINWLRIRPHAGAPDPEHRGGFWDGVTRAVMRRPVISLAVGAAVLLAAAASWLDMRTGFSGISTFPERLESKQGFNILAKEFSGGLSSPVEIVVDGEVSSPAVQGGIERLRSSLQTDGFFGPSQVEINQARDLALVSAPVNGDPNSKAAADSIDKVRDSYIPEAFPAGTPAKALVGGETAFNKDFFDLTDRYMPIVFAFVLGLSFVLLTVAFRSVVVPLKALLLNLLSVGAAYGLIVLVSQKGVGAGLLGFRQVEVIEAWLPLFLFSVLFGLSMDYHVFLLSRIREHFDQTGDNTESVAYGLRTTAGIITGAALIMVAVFGGFATGDLVSFQQMGFGLAVAVLIDATIVRSILVPASMKLLGDRNWYLPRWLRWLPQLSVEGPQPVAVTAGAASVPVDAAPPGPTGDGDTEARPATQWPDAAGRRR